MDSLVHLLVRQGGPSTQPRNATLDGHPGVRLEVEVPPLALERCADGQYSLWRASDGGVHSLDVAGVVNHLWVLDVDGTPLVVVVTAYPDQPNEQPEDLLAVAETITFEPPTA